MYNLTRAIFPLLFLCHAFTAAHAQPARVGSDAELHLRLAQLDSANVQLSFLIRPVNAPDAEYLALLNRFDTGRALTVVPLELRMWSRYHSKFPYARNDGGMIPGRGFSSGLSAGFFARFGLLRLQANPEWLWAENRPFQQFPLAYPDWMWNAWYMNLMNRIDRPERFGTESYARLSAGQSFLKADIGSFSIGVSSENLWWGPGERNALIMTNNADGFWHLSLETLAPLRTAAGSFEGRMILGRLANSGIAALPAGSGVSYQADLYLPPPDAPRFLSGLALSWQPRWTPGLFVGTAITLTGYDRDVKRLWDVLPVIGSLANRPDSEWNDRLNASNEVFDERASVFARYLMPESGAEIYMEWGREVRPASLADLWEFPEHTRGYVLGMRKRWETGEPGTLYLLAELTQLEKTHTWRNREYPMWYTHHHVRHGYTNRGQVLGAGIGPGSNSQYMGLDWISSGWEKERTARRAGEGVRGLAGMGWKAGVFAERVVHNNDLYYIFFRTTRLRHWVDMNYGLRAETAIGRVFVSGALVYTRSFNYQYNYLPSPPFVYRGYDLSNTFVEVSLRYGF